jgi:ribosome recycling factor
VNPNNDGNVIRINIPQLTEERRKDLVKVVRKRAEEGKVAVRNIRREANDMIKASEKDKLVSEDASKKGLDDIQKLTDKYIKDIDVILQAKEKEIMEV